MQGVLGLPWGGCTALLTAAPTTTTTTAASGQLEACGLRCAAP